MTREEAKREMLFAKREVMADSWIDKAYDVAIKALEEPERKKGEWILVTDDNGQHYVCDHCGQWRYHQGQKFCSECGLKMEEGEQE